MRWIAILVSLAVIVGAAPAHAADDLRSFEIRDLRIPKREVLEISLHPTETPIEIDASVDGLEVCPVGWPGMSGFRECLPLDADGHLELPSVGSDTFHLGIWIREIDGAGVRVKRLKISYEPGDGYFIVHVPAIAAGRRSPPMFVTPHTRPSVGVGPYTREFGFIEDAEVTVRQGSRRVRPAGEVVGRSEAAYGPVELDRRVRVTVKNTGTAPLELHLLVDWD